MVTTPGSSIVSASARPLAVECVWHTHCFSLIFSVLPPQALQTLLPHHFPTGCFEPVPQVSTDPKARFHSRTFKVNSSISAWSCPFYLSKKGCIPRWKWVHCSVSNTLFSARSSMGASKHLSLSTPAPSLLENTTSKLRAEWRLSKAFFFFQQVVKWSRHDKEPRNLVSILFSSLNI